MPNLQIRDDTTGQYTEVSAAHPLPVTGTGGGAATVADGANVVEGATTDAAITTNTTGTISGKLRGLVAILADVWVSASHWLQVQVQASENHIGEVGGNSAIVSANFTRPADTTAYASGDLVANNTTAASVTPLSWALARKNAGTGMIRRVKLTKSTTSLTNASFRVHFYGVTPATITNGDNGAWSTSRSTYLGSCDVTMDKAFTDAAQGIGVPAVGSEIVFVAGGGVTTIFGLLEARAAYTPGNAEVFTCEVEVLRD